MIVPCLCSSVCFQGHRFTETLKWLESIVQRGKSTHMSVSPYTRNLSLHNILFFFLSRGTYNSLLFLLPVILWSVLYTTPKFFELRHAYEPINNNSSSNNTFEDIEYRLKIVPTEMRKNKHYIRGYLIWANLFMQVRWRLRKTGSFSPGKRSISAFTQSVKKSVLSRTAFIIYDCCQVVLSYLGNILENIPQITLSF